MAESNSVCDCEDCDDPSKRVRQEILDIYTLTSRALPDTSKQPSCVFEKAGDVSPLEDGIIRPKYVKMCTRIPRDDPRAVPCPTAPKSRTRGFTIFSRYTLLIIVILLALSLLLMYFYDYNFAPIIIFLKPNFLNTSNKS
ncbi:hypothetical protein WA026_009785 [Henosepilachna vigintioctopunctata]|uniref:Uncharacterized protein n=1 Tax=Henosepilachna vigintioctopunctata TaxID=420089 RepID=A0AAW1TQA5_9CUCU